MAMILSHRHSSVAPSPRWFARTARNDCPGNLLAVPNPLEALAALATFWRKRFALPVAAVCGSNGKTTVKEMTAAILRAQYGVAQVLATAGNFNNQIGLPLTVLGLRTTHRVAVIEIGMNHSGETAHLAAIAQPTIGAINNAQREHQEFMHGLAEVAVEHAAVLSALPSGGIAVINADDDFAPFWRDVIARRNADGTELKICDFGLLAPAAVSATYRAEGWGSVLDVQTAEGRVAVELHVAGRHNVANALAAIATAISAGAGLDAIGAGLNAFRPVAGRLETKSGLAGATIIDDTYNANPDSVRAAISVLARADGKRWLVLGDMGEVGERGVALHREIGEYARAAGTDRLLAVGALAAQAVAAFGDGGEHFPDVESLADVVGTDLHAGLTVLVKGSRFMRMERVVDALTGTTAEGRH